MVTGLTPGATYYFRVRSVGGVPDEWSEVASVTLLSEATVPLVETAPVSDITPTGATGGGAISWDGGEPITQRGVCWSASPDPTTNDQATAHGGGTNSFSGGMAPLTPGQDYYVRAYAVNAKGAGYGGQVEFRAACFTNAPVALEAVDAGDTQFRARWEPQAGATGYRLDVSTGASFGEGGGARATILRETMGVVAGTTAIAAHGGFDHAELTMGDGGAANPADVRLAFDNLSWTNAGSGGSFIPGYEDKLVEATSAVVTELTPGATYYYRVRAASADCQSEHSAIQPVTTASGGESHVITAAAGEHGVISPSGGVLVNAGADQAFIITAATMYRIASLETNGSAIAEIFGNLSTNYAFVWSNVLAGGTLHASFSPILTTNSPVPVPRVWLGGHYPEGEDFETLAMSDTDGDGLTAWQEYIAGTDPTNQASVLAARADAFSPEGPVITWLGTPLPNRRYSICRTDSLLMSLEELSTNIPSTYPALNVYTDAVEQVEGRAFYRIRVRLEE